jgi:hypothetical protein
MGAKNRSVPVDTVLPHVVYQNLAEAMAWLERVFGFEERLSTGSINMRRWIWMGTIGCSRDMRRM